MPLDPQVEAYMTQMAALNVPPLNTFTPEAIRQLIQMQIDSGASQFGEPEPIAHVENRAIPGPAGDIPVRIYSC